MRATMRWLLSAGDGLLQQGCHLVFGSAHGMGIRQFEGPEGAVPLGAPLVIEKCAALAGKLERQFAVAILGRDFGEKNSGPHVVDQCSHLCPVIRSGVGVDPQLVIFLLTANGEFRKFPRTVVALHREVAMHFLHLFWIGARHVRIVARGASRSRTGFLGRGSHVGVARRSRLAVLLGKVGFEGVGHLEIAETFLEFTDALRQRFVLFLVHQFFSGGPDSHSHQAGAEDERERKSTGYERSFEQGCEGNAKGQAREGDPTNCRDTRHPRVSSPLFP